MHILKLCLLVLCVVSAEHCRSTPFDLEKVQATHGASSRRNAQHMHQKLYDIFQQSNIPKYANWDARVNENRIDLARTITTSLFGFSVPDRHNVLLINAPLAAFSTRPICTSEEFTAILCAFWDMTEYDPTQIVLKSVKRRFKDICDQSPKAHLSDHVTMFQRLLKMVYDVRRAHNVGRDIQRTQSYASLSKGDLVSSLLHMTMRLKESLLMRHFASAAPAAGLPRYLRRVQQHRAIKTYKAIQGAEDALFDAYQILAHLQQRGTRHFTLPVQKAYSDVRGARDRALNQEKGYGVSKELTLLLNMRTQALRASLQKSYKLELERLYFIQEAKGLCMRVAEILEPDNEIAQALRALEEMLSPKPSHFTSATVFIQTLIKRTNVLQNLFVQQQERARVVRESKKHLI